MTGKLIYMFTYRKNRFNNLFWLLTLITLISCGEGYEKVEGQWTWVLHSEAGKHMREIEIDNGTFEILDNKSYAKDKSSVFWRGLINSGPADRAGRFTLCVCFVTTL